MEPAAQVQTVSARLENGVAVGPISGGYSGDINYGNDVKPPSVVDFMDPHTVLDTLGTFDPTPTADGINAALYGAEGDWPNAAISMAGMVPYFGDAAKVGIKM